ncbi:MAG: glycosyltransferase [Gemmatimonadaceae bacterium]|nr:glycosyltransferase [Gemmatimonadaceae bacterium]
MSRRPACSVIVPARNAAGMLPRTLGAICGSDLPRDQWELIVVDDGSTDETASVAARYADTVVRLPGRANGPAYARNRGFEVSLGEVVMFFDADVVVHPDTMRRFLEVMREVPDAGAVFGSYDNRPAAPGFVSQYRNLLHHHVHQQNAGDADTFWAGAGAVRREVFEEAGMYDEWHYPRPQIEDIEMGGRIRRLGHRILLRPEIQATHLKRWTLRGVLMTDLKDRGIPWARLLAHRGSMLSSGTLNLKWTEKLNTILVWLGTLLLGLALVMWDWRIAMPGALCLAVAVTISTPLLGFFARTRGVWFAIRVIPVHLLYYLLNGVSFGLGMLLHELIGAPRQDPTIEAYAEVGVKRWPPVPSRNRSTWTADKEQNA